MWYGILLFHNRIHIDSFDTFFLKKSFYSYDVFMDKYALNAL